jgi:hypothetical protein
VRGDHVADVLAHNAAACAAEDVADEENVQKAALSFQLPAFSQERC